MTDTPIPREQQMLGDIAERAYALACKLSDQAMAAETPEETGQIAGDFHRVARTLSQTLTLKTRMAREAERDLRDNPPPPAPAPPRDTARIRQRINDLRQPVRRVIWAEHQDRDDAEIVEYYFDLLETRLQLYARDSAFGLEPLDDHIVRLCRDLGLSEVAARDWRNLPDPDHPPPPRIRGRRRQLEHSG